MAKKADITFHECRFVLASQLFRGLNKLWDELVESDPPFTWGDNNRSLVTADDIVRALEDWSRVSEKQLSQLRKRINAIGWQTYVDLEN
jgi:hypothetical protein